MNNHGGMAVALVGATASGKSAVAHELALTSSAGIEILAVDSMTVYRGMDIGTAKPTAQEQREVTYHLLDVAEPTEEFTVADFQRCARDAAALVWNLGGSVLYVGGTGLYGRAVIDNFDIPGQYPEVRDALLARVGDLPGLYHELAAVDPVAASRMEPTNERRILRALEVTLGSGLPFSSFGAGVRHYGPVRVVQVGLDVPLEEIDRRIEERFRGWMEAGLLEEVCQLAPRGLSRTARQAVGYKELLAHVEDGVELEKCITAAITHSRQLARRQHKWFHRDPRVEWFTSPEAAAERLSDILSSPDGFVRD